LAKQEQLFPFTQAPFEEQTFGFVGSKPLHEKFKHLGPRNPEKQEQVSMRIQVPFPLQIFGES
jgi:hypothetical protein